MYLWVDGPGGTVANARADPRAADTAWSVLRVRLRGDFGRLDGPRTRQTPETTTI